MYAGLYTFVKYITTNTRSANTLFSSCLSVRLAVRHGQCTYPDLLELKINCYVNYAGGGNIIIITVTPHRGRLHKDACK